MSLVLMANAYGISTQITLMSQMGRKQPITFQPGNSKYPYISPYRIRRLLSDYSDSGCSDSFGWWPSGTSAAKDH